MDAIGLKLSSSVSALKSFELATSDSGLTSNAGGKSSAQHLKLSNMTSKSLIHGLQFRRRSLRRSGSVEAVLIEPTNLNTAKFADYSQLSEETHSAILNSSFTTSTPSMTPASPSTLASTAERMRREMIPLHHLRQGEMADYNPLVYRQLFVIRSYEVGPDKSTSIREIFSLFQEMALNHVHLLGIAGDGFGATTAMNRLGLIWVVTKMQVDVDRYPAWPEAIEIESWVAAAGKNGMRRDWVMRSFQTGEVLARATSTWCMMNGTTRRLSKIPDEVRSEIEPAFTPESRSAYGVNESSAARISKLDDNSGEHRSSQLTSSLADLDMNQHVNNLKYINWVLESVPVEHMKTHKVASMVLEYRRECHSTDVVESLTSSKTSIDGQSGSDSDEENASVEMAMGSCRCQYTHLLRTQEAGQQEILRGKTTWRSRSADVTDCSRMRSMF